MPPELLHELRQPPPDGGQWLLAPAAALKPIKRVEFLAPIAHLLGETPLREAWRELFATEGGFSVDFLMIYARRIAAALAGAPPPLAEALVRDGLVDVWPSLRDAWRDSVVSIVADLAPFLPAEWLAPLRPDAHFGGGVSSGARSDVFAALACRWAALGDSGAALRWFRAMPYRDHAEDSAATIIANVAPEYLAMWVDEALRTLTERPRYARWCVALQRRMESAPHAAVRNCVAVWLAALPQRGVEPAWVELPAFIGALAPHGDPAAQALLEAAFR